MSGVKGICCGHHRFLSFDCAPGADDDNSERFSSPSQLFTINYNYRDVRRSSNWSCDGCRWLAPRRMRRNSLVLLSPLQSRVYFPAASLFTVHSTAVQRRIAIRRRFDISGRSATARIAGTELRHWSWTNGAADLRVGDVKQYRTLWPARGQKRFTKCRNPAVY
jgi:hypothetical protein